ncbi:DUF5119 domain-containing protein [Dysgonomonas sp. 511]|uniref:DUF5119 domain-containing protein n=1 Tax=Dysgonomonas sp. 511 TaxID=2302930 RepID=UPI0013D22432|nr:DUF5119 domain-containing protein [Dysgonomonas sp. 511]NDV77915.1 DUF5119 domain-containing protein [Dysgonomonas sp. 511]
MKKIYYLLLLLLIAVSCKNKDLCEDGPCIEGNVTIKVVVNWENPENEARPMRMNIFSMSDGVSDYGIDQIPIGGVKYITLVESAAYRPYCYDYYADIYFRNETTPKLFEAYCAEASRATYNELATPVEGERTVMDPRGDFYVHSWLKNFDVVFCQDSVLVLNFYPKNILRRFTYRVNGIKGEKFIGSARGAISGMAATYFFYTGELTTERSTVLFENSTVGTDENGRGYIEGDFYTFGPVYPYQNRFTIEILAKGSKYFTAYWDVSGQINESMTDRPAKLARDGYDILIDNDIDTDIPEIPDPGEGSGDGGGFEIGVGDWNNVDIYL